MQITDALRGMVSKESLTSLDNTMSGRSAQNIASSEQFIFVRTNGSDAEGTGSSAQPFRTIQRALQVPPSEIPNGAIYRIDCTGIGEEVFPPNYVFPKFTGTVGIGEFDFSQPYFHYYDLVNIQATPNLIETIEAGVATPSNDPDTDLLSITVAPSPGWTVDEHQGRFLVGAGGATQNCVIASNTEDTLVVTRRTAPTFPVKIMEPSAHIRAPFVASPAIHTSALNIRNTQIALLGLKISATNGPGAFGFATDGNMAPVSIQLCHIVEGQFATETWSRVRQCYLENHFACMAPVLAQQCFFKGVSGATGFLLWGARNQECFLNENIFDGVTPLRFTDLIEEFRSATIGAYLVRRCHIKNSIPDPVTGYDDGIVFQGVHGTLNHVKVDNAPGNGVVVTGPGTKLLVKHLTGTGNGEHGVEILDGALLQVDDATGTHPHDTAGPATSITGTGGDLKVGDLAAQSWPGPAPAALNTSDPITGGTGATSTGTNSRAYGTVGSA